MEPRLIWARFDDISSRDLYEILALRGYVFVVEQDCAFLDIDGRDLIAETQHAWLTVDAEIVAYLRVFPVGEDTVKMSRVVTAMTHRGNGLAALLIQAVHERFDHAEIVIDAQTRLADWYEQFGYVANGEPFLEDDIQHTPMRLRR